MSEKRPRRLAALLSMALAAALLLSACGGGKQDISAFQEKAELLRREALADWVRLELGDTPAGEAGHVVFLSVCDGRERASVYSAAAKTLDEAWENAVFAAGAALEKSGLEPKWLKADLVYLSGSFSAQELKDALDYSEKGFVYYGAALDSNFETALLEAELNAASIYDYENGGIDLDALNGYLKAAGREQVRALPDTYRLFRTAGWICGEDYLVRRISASGLDYGRRIVETVDRETAAPMIRTAAAWIAAQQQKDGGIPVQAGGNVDPAVHARALSALLRAYRLEPSEDLEEAIRRAAAYLADKTVYDSLGRAFLPSGEEITLEAGALASAALAEYEALFQGGKNLEVCRALGNGVLAMLNRTSGQFVHVMDGNFHPVTASRGPGYDGAAVYALCRLYSLTGEAEYLDAARTAADLHIPAGPGSGDSRTALAVNELSKCVPDNASYYVFALENAQKNLEAIYGLDTASPGGLVVLMSAYEAYDRMTGYGGSAEGFYLEPLLRTISARAQRQLDGYLFPEYAMYREDPGGVLGAFMTREDGLSVRTAQVCENIEGYNLYCANYENLLADGLLEAGE